MKHRSPRRAGRVNLPRTDGGAKLFAAPRERIWLFGITLVLATILVYLPVWNAGFVFDDNLHLTQNPCIVGPLGLKEVWTTWRAVYYPLVLTTFWALHKLVALNPLPYHLLNVLLHAGSAVLLWRVLRQLKVPGGWLGAAIWALHPVMVQSVAWVTELKNTESCLLYLASILCFLKWQESCGEEGAVSKASQRGSRGRGSAGLFVLSVLFFLLAVLSKSSVVMLPAVLALCIWWQNRRITWRNMLSLAPFAAISAAASAWTIWEEKFHSGAMGPDLAQTWPERFIIAGRATWFYLTKLLWPTRLTFIYPRWQIDSSQLTAWLPLFAALAGLTALWFVRAKWGRAVLFAVAYFVVSLFPIIGFFSVSYFNYSFVSDHFQYLASMGPLALAGAGIALAASRRGETAAMSLARTTTRHRHRSVAVTLSTSTVTRQSLLSVLMSSVLLVFLGFLTWRQSATYSDAETLYRKTIERNPDCWAAENNLGGELKDKGDADGAIPHFEKSLQLKPDYRDAHYNLGQALLGKGKVEEAMAEARAALNLGPNDSDAHGLLGAVLMTKGMVDDAVVQFSKALEIRPDNSEAQYDLAVTLLEKHETADAVAHYEKAIEARPDYYKALTNLAWIFATSTDAGLRRGSRAVELAEKANRVTGGTDPLVLRTLAAAYANDNRFGQALETSRRALQSAQAARDSELAEEIHREITSYEAGLPYRAP